MRIALATCRNLPDWEVDDRPLHRALAARGVEVVHPAWDDPLFAWEGCDACLVRTTWDYMERHGEFVAWAERVARLTRLFNPPDVVRWNTHKTYLRELEAAGLPVVPTVWLTAGERVDVAATLHDRGWSRGFVKPAVGATARETLPFAADAAGLEAAQAHVDRLLVREDLLLQPYLPSVETDGELSILLLDGGVSHAVRKRPVPGDYRVQDDFGASDALEPWSEELGDLAARVGEWLAGRGWGGLLYGRIDALRDDQGHLCITELELVEPSLFLRHRPEAALDLADALLRRVRSR